jgi:WD40 repeat protein
LDSYVAQFRDDGQSCALISPAGVQLHAFERPALHRELPEDLGPRLERATFSPDGRWLAASGDRRLGVWDLTRNAPGAFDEKGFGTKLFWSPDGRELFGSRRMDDCFRWQAQPATNSSAPPLLQRLELQKPGGFASFTLFSNLVVWTGSRGSRTTALENVAVDEGLWSHTTPGLNGTSPDNRWLAIYRPYTPVLFIYRLPLLEPVARLTNRANIGGFAFSPLGDEVAISSGGQVEFWSTAQWERTRALTGASMPTSLLFEPDGQAFWLGTDARTAGLYHSATLKPILMLPTGMLPLALSADGRQLAVSVHGQHLQAWDLIAVREKLRELGLDWREH